MSETVRKTINNPESFSPKKPIILELASQAPHKRESVELPNEFSVTERGVRKVNNGDPHCMVFPSLTRALGTFLGTEARQLNDYNYALQMGISTEGFALYYDEHFNKNGANKWGERIIRNSLLIGGIQHRIAGINKAVVCDELINFETVNRSVCECLFNDYPVLIKQNGVDTYLFVTGYKNNGEILTAYKFFGGGNGNHALDLKAACEDYSDWKNEMEAIIYIEQISEPNEANRIEIIKETLQIVYEMLTDKQLPNTGNYDYGDQLYKLWISRLDNDSNYENEKDKTKYVYPEIADYHERRLYTAGFFEQCHNLLGRGTLIKSGEAFAEIHNNLKPLYELIKGKGEIKMPGRKARDKIITTLRECQKQDHIAAQHIKETLALLEN